MTKQYDSGELLIQNILKGVDILADNVASTLGPKGRNVILKDKNKSPIITKDGVTVARFVELADPMQNVGVQIVKQASEQTNAEAGDGTTTATVLARAILRQAQRYLTAGSTPIELKRGMDLAVTAIVEQLAEMSRPISSIEDIERIATISANGDTTIGKLVSTAIDQTGKDGAVTIDESRSTETSLEVTEGFQLESGYLSPKFITDERRGVVKYEDPFILVTDGHIERIDEMLPVLELVARENRPLVIVAENIEGQALAALIMNAIRGTLRVAAVKAPRYGEERRHILEDLALSMGATYVAQSVGTKLSDVTLAHLGTAQSIEITKYDTTIVGGKGDQDQIEERIQALKAQLVQTDSLYECERTQNRITKLASGIAIIAVGAPTEVEMIEKRHRIEDALEAVRSAQQEGIVPGGGTALLRAARNINVTTPNDEQGLGVKIIEQSISEPIRQMAQNAGESPDIILSLLHEAEDNIGYNFATGELADMMEAGIIDPVKVTRCALQNAVSVASTLITTNYAIVQTD